MSTKPKSPAKIAPSGAENDAIALAVRERDNRAPRTRVEVRRTASGKLQIVGGGHSDDAGWLARLENALGTHGPPFVFATLKQLVEAATTSSGDFDADRLDAMVAMIEGAAPANEIEAALAVQMAMVHFASLTVMRRAMRVDQIPQFESAAGMAVKLARTFAMQAEALAKLKRGGEQVVRVVHVHPGAQAIVGNVDAKAK